VLKTPLGAPRAYAFCERFVGLVRPECIDHVLNFIVPHLRRVMQDYVAYFNHERPHHGIDQHIPEELSTAVLPDVGASIAVNPILGGLHHAYRRQTT
jgi:putative transposase